MQLIAMIEQAHLDEKSQAEKVVEPVDPVTGEKGIRVCGDGTEWIFEDLRAVRRDYVARSFCYADDRDLNRLIAEVYRLAPSDLFKTSADYYPERATP